MLAWRSVTFNLHMAKDSGVSIRVPWLEEVGSERKTLEGRLASPETEALVGQAVSLLPLEGVPYLGEPLTAVVRSVHRYVNLDSFIGGKRWREAVPQATSLAEAKSLLLSLSDSLGPIYAPERIKAAGGIDAIWLEMCV